ncbi:hypothetical protein DL768_005526 [Monosporascus sp. mg162]|nr:hypothetical protein DL768_005526 [Monosporascus sp. mg162]
MQFSTVLSVLAMGLVASAAPDVQARSGKKDVCCSGTLNCVVVVLGSACDDGHSKWQCETDSKEGSKINVLDVNLQCVKVL